MTTETPAADAEREALLYYLNEKATSPIARQDMKAIYAEILAALRSDMATIATLTQENELLRDGLNRLLSYIDGMEAKQSTKNDNAMFIDTRAFCGLKCEAVTVRNNLALAAPEAAPKQSAE